MYIFKTIFFTIFFTKISNKTLTYQFNEILYIAEILCRIKYWFYFTIKIICQVNTGYFFHFRFNAITAINIILFVNCARISSLPPVFYSCRFIIISTQNNSKSGFIFHSNLFFTTVLLKRQY